MNDYDFTLKFKLQNSDVNFDQLVEALGRGGCADALIGTGTPGSIAFDFTRAARSAFDAVLSALGDIKKVIPDAKLIEAAPDFVGLADVADYLGCSQQNVWKLKAGSATEFPIPVHEGNPSIWHLAEILLWLKDQGSYKFEERLIEIARINMQVNLAKEANGLEPKIQEKMHALIA
ncbi:MAG: DNA-binding protein [Sulfuricellaceae bacterium]